MSLVAYLALSSALLLDGLAGQDLAQQNIETEVKHFLDASEELADWMFEMDELATLDELTRLVRLDELVSRARETIYPGDAEANRIRRELLASKKEAFAAVLDELQRIPSDPYERFARTVFAHSLLFEMVRGGFALNGTRDIADFDDTEAIAGWQSFWELNRDVNEFWQKGERSSVRVPDRPAFIWTELVMEPGARIVAKTPVGEIEIAADEGFGRSYTWNGATRFAVHDPRLERWYGSLGMYFTGLGPHWEDNGGVTNGVLEEGAEALRIGGRSKSVDR